MLPTLAIPFGKLKPEGASEPTKGAMMAGGDGGGGEGGGDGGAGGGGGGGGEGGGDGSGQLITLVPSVQG